ncbi:hypothetical protein [Caulobacter sp. UC70_42]|uniref:hypothetical protein n=1 Tax=Caulobacter sp. UC70_42 TaxID=3374551 RepID=UPI0037579A7E
MSPLAIRQALRIKREDAATYRRWAGECPVQGWAAEYTQIAARLEAEAAELEREQQKETVQ